MGFLSTYDTDVDFWEMFPQMAVIASFKELKEQENSSKIMWGIVFLCDPSDENMFRNIPREEKEKLIAKDFIEDESFKWEQYDEQINMFTDMTMTQAERSLKTWNEIMSIRDYSLKEFFKEALEEKEIKLIKELDTLLSKTAKYYDDYEKVKRNFEEEVNKKSTGEKIKSLSDSGEI